MSEKQHHSPIFTCNFISLYLPHSVFFKKLNILLFSSLLKERVSDFHDTTYVPLLIPTCAQEGFLRHTLHLALLLLPLSWNLPLRLTSFVLSFSLLAGPVLTARSTWSPTSSFPPSLTAPVSSCTLAAASAFVYCYSPLEE